MVVYMPQEAINKYSHIFFNALFLAFAAFGLYLSFCDAYRYKGDAGRMFFASLMFSLAACVLWNGSHIWNNILKLAVNLIIVIIIIKNYGHIEKDFGILYAYIKRQYYIYKGIGTVPVNKRTADTSLLGFTINERLAMILVVFLIIMAMAVAVLKMRWYFLLLLPAVLVIGMEMFHGKAPSVKASFFLVTGFTGLLFSIRLEMCGGRKNFWQDKHIPGQIPLRYILFIGIITVCFILSLITGKVTHKRIFAHSGKVLERQHKIEKEAKVIAEAVKNRISGGEDGYLDNKSPDQTGRSVFRIETDKKPQNNIYIKNFSKDIYENGMWKSFKEEPPVTGTDTYNSFKSYIASRKHTFVSSDWTDEVDNFNMDIIPDWKFGSKNTFIPYMYNINNEGYQFNCYNMQNWMMQYILSIYTGELEVYGIKDNKEYTSFVYDKYLQVPENLTRLRSFADGIFTWDDIGGMCVSVKNAICKDTRYSQNLDDVPYGQDYIEYFLFRQKKGYCEHYATAGTILLRLKNIPARYVSGYFIRPSEFRLETGESGGEKYVAYVKDYNAHAWTEVYKEGFGWLPFDMTNTILDDEYTMDSENLPENNGEIQEDFSQEIDESEENKDTSSKKDTELKEDLQEDTSDLDDKGNVPDKNGKKAGSLSSIFKIPKKFLLIAAVLLFIFIPIIYIRAGFIYTVKKICHENISNKRVVLYFALLNNYLAFCGFKGISKLEDTEYAAKISGILPGKTFENAYMLLQCAAFSNNNIKLEDEREVLLFVQNVSGRAYKNCSRLSRAVIYILTGRKNINIFTKAYN